MIIIIIIAIEEQRESNRSTTSLAYGYSRNTITNPLNGHALLSLAGLSLKNPFKRIAIRSYNGCCDNHLDVLGHPSLFLHRSFVCIKHLSFAEFARRSWVENEVQSYLFTGLKFQG